MCAPYYLMCTMYITSLTSMTTYAQQNPPLSLMETKRSFFSIMKGEFQNNGLYAKLFPFDVQNYRLLPHSMYTTTSCSLFQCVQQLDQ
jgi:hypothetical protein